MNIRSFLLIASVGILAGCDRNVLTNPFERHDPSAAEHQEEVVRPERESEVSRLEGERQVLRLKVQTAGAIVSNGIERLERTIGEVESDRRDFSDRIKALSARERSGGESVLAETLLALLADDRMNDLAIRYLGHDFRISRLGLLDGLSEASAATKRRDAALEANKSASEAQIREARAEKTLARESAQRSTEKLAAEISDVERRRDELKRRLQFVSAVERKRLDQELNTHESRLRMLRNSYNSMRSSLQVTEERRRAGREEENNIAAISRRRAEEDDRVLRRFRGIKNRQELVSVCEETTIRALEKEMARRIKSLNVSLSEVRKAIVFIRATSAGIDRLGLFALEKTRDEIDAKVKKVEFPE